MNNCLNNKLLYVFFSSNVWNSLVPYRNNFSFTSISISSCIHIFYFETEMYVLTKNVNTRLRCSGRKWQEIWDSSNKDSSRRRWDRHTSRIHGDIGYYLWHWFEHVIICLEHCLQFLSKSMFENRCPYSKKNYKIRKNEITTKKTI